MAQNVYQLRINCTNKPAKIGVVVSGMSEYMFVSGMSAAIIQRYHHI
jgi:hypothetical protein